MNLNDFKCFGHIKLVLLQVSCGFLLFATQVSAETGINDQTIVLGQSCVMSGPSEDIGRQMNAGLTCAFSEINVSGGIHGRTIRLLVKDDFYEPGQAIKNTETFIFKNRVFALIGEVGTPTSRVVLPITEKEKIPFIAPFTGARFLREPVKSQVINIRAGYDEETMQIVTYMAQKKGFKKIACFYQNDSFGFAGLEGVRTALKKFGLTPICEQSYQRNTVAVMGGFLRIKKCAPQGVILVGSYQPCAEFIKLAKAKGMEKTTFATLSFAGSRSLITALREQTDHVIVSQVMPSPVDDRRKLVKRYLKAMNTYQPELGPSHISLEGYIAGRLFIDVIKALGKDHITRDAFIAHIENKKQFRIDDMVLTFGPNDHQGLDHTYLTRIRDNRLIPLTD